MLISELIEELQRLKKQLGDVEVMYESSNAECNYSGISEINAEYWEKDGKIVEFVGIF